MNCENCGAPMLLVRERDYFFCEYCGSFHFPHPTEEGLRLLDEAPERLACPTCKVRLHRGSLDGNRLYTCPNCRGILIPLIVFGETVGRLRARAKGPADKPRPLNPRELERKINCPSCHNRMETHPYSGPGNIVIDTCISCGLLWLDPGELRQVIDAPGRDRGPDARDERADLEDSWLAKKLKR
jgi:Zn-finger nucleic acid-binding protein